MSSLHPARRPPDELLAECDARFQRRGGPGGQHRNKVATAVVLLHRPTGIAAEANERRSQAANRAEALRRLRLRLAVELRSPDDVDSPTPSALWQRRSAGGRISVNPSHHDFPSLLAEALDAVASNEFDLTAAARRLGVTASQLAGLVRREPAAWTLVNEGRRARGLRQLH